MNLTTKPYDLEERTFAFARDIMKLCKRLRLDVVNRELISQLVRAAGSVGANYREANEALSQKDFLHRIKISRKECKESTYWLGLLAEMNSAEHKEINSFISESKELRNIFSSILNKKAAKPEPVLVV